MIKNLIKPFISPILSKIYKKLVFKKKLLPQKINTEKQDANIKKIIGEKKSRDWYDGAYLSAEGQILYNTHYTKSPYYYLWSIIIEKLNYANPGLILELGCGAGQLASLIRDKGFKNYIGIDFSKVAIDIATKVCPEFKFICEDILNSENLKNKL